MKKNIFKISVVLIMLVLVYATIVNALSFTASMTPSKPAVEEATEFTVEVKVSNLDVGTNGINSLTGYLKYDSDIFETISKASIEGLNNWTVSFDETTGKVELTKTEFVKTAEEVFQITFKTKAGVSGKTGSITYSNISASNSESEIKATDIATSITVGSESEATNTNTNTNVINITALTSNNTNNNNAVNNASNNIVNNAVVSSSVNNVSNYVNTTVEDDMPYTGVDDTIVGMIFVVIAIAIVFYIKIEKLNKDIK